MIKIVAMIKRRPDLSLDEFRRYYHDRHAPLFARSIPDDVDTAIRHYVQNHAVALDGRSSDAPFDCITEIGFDDLDGVRCWSDWYLGDGGKVLRDDELNFMDVDRRVVVVTDEYRPVDR